MLSNIQVYLKEVNFKLILIFIVQVWRKDLDLICVADEDVLLRECNSFWLWRHDQIRVFNILWIEDAQSVTIALLTTQDINRDKLK